MSPILQACLFPFLVGFVLRAPDVVAVRNPSLEGGGSQRGVGPRGGRVQREGGSPSGGGITLSCDHVMGACVHVKVQEASY